MPTPFYHLFLAETLLKQPQLPVNIKHYLEPSRSEFLFGNTAPDVQVVSGQPRQETHFFALPITAGAQPPWERVLSKQPLLRANRLPQNQAAFMAGYLCHLQADWWWVKDIFAPIFGLHSSWATFPKRLYYHNVLRSYQELQILPQLPPGLHGWLRQVEPDNWLPFVLDNQLREWRDYLYPQLKTGAKIRTVEVFSSRQGISAEEYYALLTSDERMTREVFSHFPFELLEKYQQRILVENIHLLSNYLAPSLHPAITHVQVKTIHGAQP